MAHETIVLEAALGDYAPPLVANNPFRDKQKKTKSDVSGVGWRGTSAATGPDKAQSGKVQVRIILS